MPAVAFQLSRKIRALRRMFETVWFTVYGTTLTHGRDLQSQEEYLTVSTLLRIDPVHLTPSLYLEADLFRHGCTKRHSVRPPCVLLPHNWPDWHRLHRKHSLNCFRRKASSAGSTRTYLNGSDMIASFYIVHLFTDNM